MIRLQRFFANVNKKQKCVNKSIKFNTMKLKNPIAKLHKSELRVASQKATRKAKNKKNWYEIPKPNVLSAKKK